MRHLAIIAAIASTAAAANPDPAVVRGELDGATARFAVTYRLAVPGPMRDEELAELVLPPGAVVTAATATVDRESHAMSLVSADDATAAFETLAQADPQDARRWLVALAQVSDGVRVSVAGERAATLELRLEVQMPTCFEHDTRYAALPASWRPHVRPVFAPAACGDGELWVSFPAAALAKLPSGERFGTLAAGLHLPGGDVGRLEVDVASELGDVPADLATAIVVDASRSLGDDARAAARHMIDAYLRAAPGSRVQVIAFARTATPLLADWTPAADAKPAIDRALDAEVPRNGSNLDVALAEAARWLDRVPGTHRVLVLTDEQLARHVAERRAELHAGGALIHVVDLDGDGPVTRDDDDALADIALASGGIAVHAGTAPMPDATLLARPVSIDHVAVAAPGWQPLATLPSTCEGDLRERAACTWWGRGGDARMPVVVTGFVWGRAVSRVARLDPSGGRDLAREIMGAGGLDDTDPDADALAREAFAIGPKWSMLVTWGGAGGYNDVGIDISRQGMGVVPDVRIGRAVAQRWGYVEGGAPVETVDAQLARAIHGCDTGHARVVLILELTGQEIVDVDATIVPPGNASPITSGAVHACVVDAVWDTPLVLGAFAGPAVRQVVIPAQAR